MDGLPNECIYDILLFLHPKYLQLCAQIDDNFNVLCQLDSLWKNKFGNEYNKLFNKTPYKIRLKIVKYIIN